MNSSVQIIDILSSSDDEDETVHNNGDNKPTITTLTNNLSNGIKPEEKEEMDLIDGPPQASRSKESHALSQQQASSNQCSVNNSPNKELTSEACAESRRRKIDILLDNYERGQHRLRTVESMMDAAQKLRWLRLQSSNSQSASVPFEAQFGHHQASSSSGPNPRPNYAAPHQPFQRPPWFIDPPGEVVRTVRVTTTTRTTRPYKKKTYKKKKARSSAAKRVTKAAPRASTARTSSARASTSYAPTRSPRKAAASSSTPLRSPKKEYTRSSPLKSPKKEFKPSVTVKRES